MTPPAPISLEMVFVVRLHPHPSLTSVFVFFVCFWFIFSVSVRVTLESEYILYPYLRVSEGRVKAFDVYNVTKQWRLK
jgi:hypothetical protein